jgi:hypothetical protein
MELGGKLASSSTSVDDLLRRRGVSLRFTDPFLEIGNGVSGFRIQMECLMLNSLKRQLHRDRLSRSEL